MTTQVRWGIVTTMMTWASALIFAYGYFYADDMMADSTSFLDNKLNLREEALRNIDILTGRCETENFSYDRLVFVVIDALRADFIPSLKNRQSIPSSVASMPFIEGQLLQGDAIGFIAEAHTPTVTLPRIKALLSGTHPNFIDLIINLNAVEFGDDNILKQAYEKGKRMIFYGDDTWLSMFPEKMFLRSKGTSSFFATDYVQVDTNVTESALPELQKLADWDFLFLHYLGVDHIGHSHGGAKSHLMKAKLEEMDNVIRTIWNSVRKENCLMIIVGDHGMTNEGNHGGSTEDETNTAMIFMSTKYNVLFMTPEPVNIVNQIDLATTIALLLDLPIPSKSKGKLIHQVLLRFNASKSTCACKLFQNAVHFLSVRSSFAHNKILEEALQLHVNSLTSETYATNAIHAYSSYLNNVQSSTIFEKTHSSNMLTLLFGIALSFISFSCLMCESTHKISISRSLSFISDESLFSVLHDFPFILYFLLVTSTSFIEFEHLYWMFISTSIVIICFSNSLVRFYRRYASIRNLDVTKTSSKQAEDVFSSLLARIFAFTVILIILRLLRVWSVVNESQLGDWLRDSDNKHASSACVILALIIIAAITPSQRTGKQRCLMASGLFWIYLYR